MSGGETADNGLRVKRYD